MHTLTPFSFPGTSHFSVCVLFVVWFACLPRSTVILHLQNGVQSCLGKGAYQGKARSEKISVVTNTERREAGHVFPGPWKPAVPSSVACNLNSSQECCSALGTDGTMPSILWLPSSPSPRWCVHSTKPSDLNIYRCITTDLQSKQPKTRVYYRTHLL